MAERDGDDGPSSSRRPSFTKFWKRIKQVHTTGNLRFVSSGSQQEQDQTAAATEAKDDVLVGGGGGGRTAKAQARRAQVRKAQIQHRQRKANYTKQLELDVAKLRGGIARVEGETAALRSENDGMRQRLAAAGVVTPLFFPSRPPHPTTTTAGAGAGAGAGAATTPTLPSPFNNARLARFSASPPPLSATAATSWMTTSPPSSTQYTVSLDMSETNSPAYQVYRTSTPLSGGSVPSRGFPRSTSDPAGGSLDSGSGGGGGGKEISLTEAQTDYAINFILALEHICWDHFHPSYFSPHHCDVDVTAEENGHMLMASAIALQSAPASVFEQMGEVKQHLQQHHHQQQQQQQKQPHGSSSSTATSQAAHHRHRPSQPSYDLSAQNQKQKQKQKPPPPKPVPSPASWPMAGSGAAGAGLTLENLRRLAGALSPPDAELTPVQAWFEIARLCGPAVALDPAAMDALRRELALHVRCVQFGAVMQRGAFDDIVGRVVGSSSGGGGGGVGIGYRGQAGFV